MLPSPRRSPALKPVPAPLSSTPLPRLIYILITLSILLISYYFYRELPYKSALGNTPPIINGAQSYANGKTESVEDRVNELARLLGIPSKELASAVAGVVRQYLPPASLSSVAAKETGEVGEALLKDENEKVEDAMPGVVHNFVSSFAGFDEDELDS